MHALIVTYTDSEKTDYYGKFGFRFAAANVMQYIWSDEEYRKQFIQLEKSHADDFAEFSNFLINDMNSLLFDGLLALEEIKLYEGLREDSVAWNSLAQEERE